jgi:hypothetical protein
MMLRPQRRPDLRVSRLGARLSPLELADLLTFHRAPPTTKPATRSVHRESRERVCIQATCIEESS